MHSTSLRKYNNLADVNFKRGESIYKILRHSEVK